MKKIILFFIVLLLSGCSLDYELEVNKDLSLIETINIIEPKTKISAYLYDVEGYVDENVEYFSSQQENDRYNIYNGSNETRAIGIAIANYKDFDDYCEINTLKDNFFSDCEIDEQGSVVTINLASVLSNDYFRSSYLEEALFSNAYFNIKIPYKVTYSNADSVDLEKSIYTWKYTTDNNLKDISITFDTAYEAQKPVNYSMYIIGGIILVVIISGIYIYYKYKQNSKY